MSLPVRQIFLLLIACLIVACESGVVRQVDYYEKVGDTASARQFLEADLQRRPDNAEARYLLAKVLFKEAAFAEGRDAFDQVEARTARYSESIQFLLESGYRDAMQQGIDALESKDMLSAVQYLTYATQIRPEYNPGHRLRGYALTQVGQLDDAAPAYQQAVMIDPDDFESWLNLSEIAFAKEDFEASRDYAKEALRRDPLNTSATRRLAHAHMNLQENEQATAVFEQLLKLKSGTDDVRDYAYFLFNIGSYEASLPHLEALAAASDPPIELLRTLSETYAGLQIFKKVIAVNEQILTRLPENRAAIGNLIAAHERLGQFDQAQAWQAMLSKLGGEL